MFSSRIPADLSPNRLTRAVEARRRAGRPFIDLTESNPTRTGFSYPDSLLAPLAHARGLRYAPAPLGLPEARAAVARDYQRAGLTVDPDRIVLTASTSEAYSILFKLLADAGDDILVPRPSYPLFDHLTRLDVVTTRPYDLDVQDGWRLDFESLERAWTRRTRAVLVVSPNNPTGSFVSKAEMQQLSEICAGRGAAIVADEVFADYELEPGAAAGAGRAAADRDALAFALGGLSKSCGLPQLKLGWMAVSGPGARVADALQRLEIICDTYLSVATPVQAAASEFVAGGAAIRAQIATRVAANYRCLQDIVARVPACRMLKSQGGWYAVVQVPTLQAEEDLALTLLEQEDVLVHPGYFFDFPRESFVIISLLTPDAHLADGVSRILRRFHG
jgi:aspartate/methionine/tyrosine aminotransferase